MISFYSVLVRISRLEEHIFKSDRESVRVIGCARATEGEGREREVGCKKRRDRQRERWDMREWQRERERDRDRWPECERVAERDGV